MSEDSTCRPGAGEPPAKVSAVRFDGVLARGHREAVEAAVPRGPRTCPVALDTWARPLEDAVRIRADRFLPAFPAARRAIGHSMRVEAGAALWRFAGARRAGEGWHIDPLAHSRLYAFWYGGDFDGGELEVEGEEVYTLMPNSLLVFWPGVPHRVHPVLRGERLSLHLVLSRWRCSRAG